jgi:hypothetical protein
MVMARSPGKAAPGRQECRRRRPFAACWIVVLCFSLLGARLSAHGQVRSEEYRLKLAFLYNFAKFVDWPADAFPSPQAPLKLCIVGRDPFDSELKQQLSERSVNGHPYVIQSLRVGDELTGCHLIFVPAGSDASFPSILRRVGNSSAITVGETMGFAHRGGTVNFVLEGTKLRFEVNLDASQRSRSRISSRLLVLAKLVKEQQP